MSPQRSDELIRDQIFSPHYHPMDFHRFPLSSQGLNTGSNPWWVITPHFVRANFLSIQRVHVVARTT
jgi:hypothetical protein